MFLFKLLERVFSDKMGFNIITGKFDDEGGSKPVEGSIKDKLWERGKGKCEKCGKQFKSHADVEVLHKDGNHGDSRMENLVALCAGCHKEATVAQHQGKAMAKRQRREQPPAALGNWKPSQANSRI